MKMTTKHSLSLIGTAAAALALAAMSPAEAGQPGPEVGTLTCKSAPGPRVNVIIRSERPVKCVFTDALGKAVKYKGAMGIGLGVDLETNRVSEITFTVFATHFDSGTHQLTGLYSGLKASVTPGVGAGAAIYVGNGEKSITLQPALEAATGFGAAVGIGYLQLEADK